MLDHPLQSNDRVAEFWNNFTKEKIPLGDIENKKEIQFTVPRESSVGDDLIQILDQPKFSDISFKVENTVIFAHKIILSARCKFFRAMFESEMIESRKTEIVIEDASYDAFKLLLMYLYSGRVSVPHSLAPEILILADKYLLPDLQKCALVTISTSLSEDNVFYLMHLGARYNAEELKILCVDFLLRDANLIAALDVENKMDTSKISFFFKKMEQSLSPKFKTIKQILQATSDNMGN